LPLGRKKRNISMSEQTKPEAVSEEQTKKPQPDSELKDAELEKVSGGAVDSFMYFQSYPTTPSEK
jgi:hypothetical protein